MARLPKTKIAKRQQLEANAGHDHELSPQELLAASQAELLEAKKKINSLESSLQNEQLQVQAKSLECSEVSFQLELALEKSKNLSDALKAEQARYDVLYKKLRVEKRARQRGQSRKNVLQDQMSILLSAGTRTSGDDDDTAKAVNSLLRQEKKNAERANVNLRSELSECLARCKSEYQESQEKLSQVKQSLKASQSLVYKLQKKSDSAAKRQQHAVTQAREQAYKEKSVHRLLHKGVYTEETRNLIRLLVKAGCSRNYVGKVISAVLKSAGITTIGNISRRTVSRVIIEGYFAAQIQLGHEMKNAESMVVNSFLGHKLMIDSKV